MTLKKVLLIIALAMQLWADYSYDMAVKADNYIKSNNYKDAKYYLEEAAKGGTNETWSKMQLGYIYLNGLGVTKNYTKAKEYFEEAANGGDIFSKGLLGTMYLNGLGVTKNYTKAKEYFEEAKAYSSLGWMYYTGDNSIKDYKKAKEYFEEAIANGDSWAAKSNLALMYFRGQGVEKNYTKARELFETVADFSDPKNNLAWMYLNGSGVEQNTQKALKLFKEAAEKENVAANLNLAWIYKNGIHVKADTKTATYWQERADDLSKKAKEENYELTYLFDAPSFDDNIALLLKKSEQKKVSNTRYLIVIGAENYDYTDSIAYSQHSAEMFAQVAQKTLGISKENTLELFNKDASMGKIKMNLKQLLRRVKNGDTIYFYYSGHGIPIATQQNEAYILPIDVAPEFISEEAFFKLQNLYKTLTDSKASKVVAFIDSCFSGATDGVSVIKGVAATRIKPKEITFDKNKMTLLTAGKDTQYSNMYKEKKYRLFTYFLMESMLKGRESLEDIYRDVYIKVKDESYKMGDMKLQEPTFSGNTSMKI